MMVFGLYFTESSLKKYIFEDEFPQCTVDLNNTVNITAAQPMIRIRVTTPGMVSPPISYLPQVSTTIHEDFEGNLIFKAFHIIFNSILHVLI